MSEKPFSLSVKVVILNPQGQCLLLRRSEQSKNNAGKWEFPGGKIDAGETFDVALVREVHEETHLEIVLDRVVGSAQSDLPDRRVAYLILAGRLDRARSVSAANTTTSSGSAPPSWRGLI